MSKKSNFRGSFETQYGKRAQTLLKSSSQHLCLIHWSLGRNLFSEKSLLLTCQILGLLVNTLAANEKYPVLNRDNLTLPIRMQLSEKQKPFSHFFAPFLKSKLSFENFWKKDDPHSFWIFEITDSSTSNMVNVPKKCLNLHYSAFVVFIGHCQVNCVWKGLSYWYEKSRDLLLTHWLSMKCILFIIENI